MLYKSDNLIKFIKICRNVVNNTLIVGEKPQKIQKELKEISKDGKAIISTKNHGEPEKLMKYARNHWKIESMHWILDVNFKEDDCPVRSKNTQKILQNQKFIKSPCQSKKLCCKVICFVLTYT